MLLCYTPQESKLQTNMNSIKSFWSPELKKERALRKQEFSKLEALREQLQVSQEELNVCRSSGCFK